MLGGVAVLRDCIRTGLLPNIHDNQQVPKRKLSMPLDHYVSQVHLKQFCSPQLVNRMYAVRKSDLKSFTPTPKDVCRIESGSNNSYLNDERAIEEFLRTVEPHYDIALQNLAVGKVDKQTIHTIAGFAAHIITCSPAGMRIRLFPAVLEN